jgi:hypothetical protein
MRSTPAFAFAALCIGAVLAGNFPARLCAQENSGENPKSRVDEMAEKMKALADSESENETDSAATPSRVTFGDKLSLEFPVGWTATAEGKGLTAQGPGGVTLTAIVVQTRKSPQEFMRAHLAPYEKMPGYELGDIDPAETKAGAKGSLALYKYEGDKGPTDELTVYLPASPNQLVVMTFAGSGSSEKFMEAIENSAEKIYRSFTSTDAPPATATGAKPTPTASAPVAEQKSGAGWPCAEATGEAAADKSSELGPRREIPGTKGVSICLPKGFVVEPPGTRADKSLVVADRKEDSLRIVVHGLRPGPVSTFLDQRLAGRAKNKPQVLARCAYELKGVSGMAVHYTEEGGETNVAFAFPAAEGKVTFVLCTSSEAFTPSEEALFRAAVASLKLSPFSAN